jgi:hypothetical protein
MGIADADDEAVSEMLRQVKEKGIAKRGLLDQGEFKEIVERVLVMRRAVIDPQHDTATSPGVTAADRSDSARPVSY